MSWLSHEENVSYITGLSRLKAAYLDGNLCGGVVVVWPFGFFSVFLEGKIQRGTSFLPDEIWMAELVHDLNFAGHHPLGFRVQFRLVDDLHSYFFWKAN